MPSTYILSDLDGVVVDLIGEAQQWLWQRYRIAIPLRCITTHEISDAVWEFMCAAYEGDTMPIDKLQLKQAFRALWDDPRVCASARPHWEMLEAIRGYGSSLEFVTKRPPENGIEEATRNWLFSYGLDGYSLRISSDPESKCHVAEGVLEHHKRVAFIEDSYSEAVLLAKRFPTLDVYLVERPWSRGMLPLDLSNLQYASEYEMAARIRRWKNEDDPIEDEVEDV